MDFPHLTYSEKGHALSKHRLAFQRLHPSRGFNRNISFELVTALQECTVDVSTSSPNCFAMLIALHSTPVSRSVGRSFGLAELQGLRACCI